MEVGLLVRRLRAEEVPLAHALEAMSYPAVSECTGVVTAMQCIGVWFMFEEIE